MFLPRVTDGRRGEKGVREALGPWGRVEGAPKIITPRGKEKIWVQFFHDPILK